MYVVHVSAMPFKDNLHRSQVATQASTLACTSDQLRSSRRSGPNHIPRMRTGPPLQQKSPGRVSLLSRHELQTFTFVKIDLGYCYSSVFGNRLLHSLMSRQRDTKTVISSANVENPCCMRASKRDTMQGRIFPLYPQSSGSKARTQRRGDNRQPCWTDRSRTNPSKRFPFTCTTVRWLWYIMLIHLQISGQIPAVSKTDDKNRWSTLSKASD